MSTKTVVDFTTWLASSPEISSNPLDNFYPANRVIEAFEHGKLEKEKEIRDQYLTLIMGRSARFFNHVNAIISSISSLGVSPQKVFYSNTIDVWRARIAIEPKAMLEKEFLMKAYGIVSQHKKEALKNEDPQILDISFITMDDRLDLAILDSEGFGFVDDFKSSDI